jgi:transposase
MQGKKPYTEKLFTHFQLSERVPAENFYRRLKGVLDLQWLYKATKQYYGTEGQQSIDPGVFFKLILIGYLENLGSDRRIISTVSMRLDMLYFIGYDIDEPLPWHSTLSRTRQLYGEDLFRELFKNVLKQCIDKGMVAGKRQAMDSAFVNANASMDSLVAKEVLEDGASYIDALQKQEIESDQQDNRNDNSVTTGASTNKDDRRKFTNHTHYSTTDKDARVSVKPGKPSQLNYLAQVSVDTAHHVITQIQSDYADKRDSQCLPSLLTNTINNLTEQGIQIEEVLADTNYSSGEALQALEDQAITGYIPNCGQYKASREGFTYDKQNDRYTCSRGVHLPFKKIATTRLGYKVRVYRSSSKDCRKCPLRSVCIGKADFKKIDDTVDKPLYDRMHARLQTNYAKRMSKIRQSTVEPVLGTLINYLSMRRINTRGIQQANKCMLMAALSYNLKKLLRWQSKKVQVNVKALQKAVSASIYEVNAFLFCHKTKINLLPVCLL